MVLLNSTKTVTLNDGNVINMLGLGTWQSAGNDGYDSVMAALKAGYRHIDGAAIYKNEEQVGKAIRDSGIPREQIFVTTKLWGTQQRTPEKALDASLRRLGLDYVDLYLMHWPVPIKSAQIQDGDYLTIPVLPSGKRDLDLEEWSFIKTWELMQELPKTGKCKSIGVSNFSINNIKDLLASPGNKITPAMNQVELHPLLPQFELAQFCKEKNIYLEAYSPLGGKNAPILSEPALEEIAKKNNVSTANVVTSWIIQREIVVLPKSVTPSRIISNLQTFTLSEEDMNTISNLSKVKGEKRTVCPDWFPFTPFI